MMVVMNIVGVAVFLVIASILVVMLLTVDGKKKRSQDDEESLNCRVNGFTGH